MIVNFSKFSLYESYSEKLSPIEEVRKYPQNNKYLQVKCSYCGNWFRPTNLEISNRLGSYRGYKGKAGEGRLYCSDKCKTECPIYNQTLYPKGFKEATSREVQAELRQLVLKRDDWTCQKCEKHQDELETGLHAHHLTGVEINPIESADVDNCITLCKDCHKEVHKLPGCTYYDYRRKKCVNE